MTLALTREFRDGADAGAAAANLLSALGRPGAAAVSCGALASGAAEDAIARGAAFRAVRGRAENLLAFTREAFDLDEEDRERGKEKGPAAGSAGRGAPPRVPPRSPRRGRRPLGARFRRRSRGGGDGVFAEKRRGELGARAFRDILTGDGNGEASRWTSWCAETRRRHKTTAFKTPTALEDAVFELVAAVMW